MNSVTQSPNLDLIDADMAAVNALIKKSLHTDIALIDQLATYIIASGGKRIRPLMMILCAKACGIETDKHILAAVIIEFIHTATLLHDDVVDESSLRRGKKAAHHVWGNQASILVGDFLYSRAFELMVQVHNPKIMEILSHATNVIAEGEVMQLLNINDPDISEAQYMKVIYSKTSKLFEAAGQIGAVLSERSEEQEQLLAKFGAHLGTAFQLIDDILDYSADAEDLGKNIGDDLSEGKPTLPLIIAMQRTEERDTQIIREAIEQGSIEHIDTITQLIHTTGAVDYAYEVARHHIDQARECINFIEDNPYKQALMNLAEDSLARSK